MLKLWLRGRCSLLLLSMSCKKQFCNVHYKIRFAIIACKIAKSYPAFFDKAPNLFLAWMHKKGGLARRHTCLVHNSTRNILL